MTEQWQLGRPIYHRLPSESQQYQKDPDSLQPGEVIVADVLTRWIDADIVALKNQVQNFYTTHLDPDASEPEYLDWAAQMCGYTGEFWDPNWSDTIKRTLIKESFARVWEQRGQERLLNWLLDLFGIPAQPDGNIWMQSYWRAGETSTPGMLGRDLYQYFVRLPLSETRGNANWKNAERLARLYSPVWIKPTVCFEYWYAGFSACGDAVFDYWYEQSKGLVSDWLEDNEPDTALLLAYLFTELEIPATVYEADPFIAGVSGAGDRVWDPPFIFVLADESLPYKGDLWAGIERIIELYCLPDEVFLCYPNAIAGTSVAAHIAAFEPGDPA